ncbi:hypothetical protein Glove_276g7 [Diversispora epigaea]|uniref:Uncharacterized protein n=1 Tax=Diversispora epigaea TaxID=1348612 RepID=A0A397I826_9GLOM|nr:hypothetical protein Glove_276g7 [Diversispora epigaea]
MTKSIAFYDILLYYNFRDPVEGNNLYKSVIDSAEKNVFTVSAYFKNYERYGVPHKLDTSQIFIKYCTSVDSVSC